MEQQTETKNIHGLALQMSELAAKHDEAMKCAILQTITYFSISREDFDTYWTKNQLKKTGFTFTDKVPEPASPGQEKTTPPTKRSLNSWQNFQRLCREDETDTRTSKERREYWASLSKDEKARYKVQSADDDTEKVCGMTFKQWTVVTLKKELDARGEPKTGRKRDLYDRLKKCEEGNDSSDDEDSGEEDSGEEEEEEEEEDCLSEEEGDEEGDEACELEHAATRPLEGLRKRVPGHRRDQHGDGDE